MHLKTFLLNEWRSWNLKIHIWSWCFLSESIFFRPQVEFGSETGHISCALSFLPVTETIRLLLEEVLSQRRKSWRGVVNLIITRTDQQAFLHRGTTAWLDVTDTRVTLSDSFMLCRRTTGWHEVRASVCSCWIVVQDPTPSLSMWELGGRIQNTVVKCKRRQGLTFPSALFFHSSQNYESSRVVGERSERQPGGRCASRLFTPPSNVQIAEVDNKSHYIKSLWYSRPCFTFTMMILCLWFGQELFIRPTVCESQEIWILAGY